MPREAWGVAAALARGAGNPELRLHPAEEMRLGEFLRPQQPVAGRTFYGPGKGRDQRALLGEWGEQRGRQQGSTDTLQDRLCLELVVGESCGDESWVRVGKPGEPEPR